LVQAPLSSGGEEERCARDVGRQQLALETLPAEQFLLASRREPQRDLPRGHDPPGHDAVDADMLLVFAAGVGWFLWWHK
jgi:hypothetical protein